MENGKVKVTKEQIEKELLKILEQKKPSNDRNIVIGQLCKTRGHIVRTALDLNLCNDAECPSCQMIHKLLDAEAKNFKNLDISKL